MSPLADPSRPNLIIGCGYLGRRVAGLWLDRGSSVAALTRRNAEALRALGIQPIRGDILEPTTLACLPEANTVLYAIAPDRKDGLQTRDILIAGLDNVVNALPLCRRFIYISSTSVYGQTNGSVVDESSPTEPVEDSGRIVLEAERLLLTRRPDAVILRLGGIYGPDRLLRRQSQLRSREPIRGDPERWLNLVHVDDAAEAVLAAELHAIPGRTYNIVDDEPTTRRAFYSELAELTGAPIPVFDNQRDPRANHRRVNNARAKAVLQWKPRFPTFRKGLPAAIAGSTG